MVEIFVELGRRLQSFINEKSTVEVFQRAISANEWFSEEEIKMAIEAICLKILNADELKAWLSHYPMPQVSRRVAIIMAGNIPLVGFFDLLCVLVCGYTAVVKLSSKDAVLMQYVIDILRDIKSDIAIEMYDENSDFDMVIATGGDVAAKYFRQKFSTKPALIRGSRHSVAVLSGAESDKQLEDLRRDMYSYSGLGCRNVSLLFVPKDWTGVIPCPESIVDAKHKNYLCDKALLTMQNAEFEDLNGALAIESHNLPIELSRIHYSRYENLEEVNQWLIENDEKIQCVVSQCITHPRRVDFGEAQYPALMDYADGVDVMKFLIA